MALAALLEKRRELERKERKRVPVLLFIAALMLIRSSLSDQ
jgi:hypothetical protein